MLDNEGFRNNAEATKSVVKSLLEEALGHGVAVDIIMMNLGSCYHNGGGG